MKKLFLALSALFPLAAFAANTNAMLSPYQYNMMEPYLNKKMREQLKPAGSEYATGSNQAMARTMTNSAKTPLSNYTVAAGSGARASSLNTRQRKVVARSAALTASAASGGRQQTTANRARAAAATGTSARRVVSRGRAATATAAREVGTPTSSVVLAQQITKPTGEITAAECLSKYSECMDNYCRRPTTRYDRCYCSSKLQQLDSEYKPAIDELMRKIVMLQNGGEITDGMSQEEINDYWNEIFGATGSNSMADLDNGLNIDWAGTESSVRGQNAFIAGDEYCKQHLTGCFYMAENMKAMYRTTIGQDCKKYETNLKKLKYSAEQVLDSLQ